MNKEELYTRVDAQESSLEGLAQKLWSYAEVAFQEVRSSELLRNHMREQGFRIREVPNMPTAFIAEYGSGYPVIGLLGEYDALPGLSQKVQTTPEPVEEGGSGHGCAHNLLAAGCVGAAIAVKDLIDAEQLAGTIRYYGCPAEEQLIGKPLMAKEGVFDDLDIALSWHPANNNEVVRFSSLAVDSIKFHFKGITAHAAMAPYLGRSALDAVELMNVGANYLREHVEDSVRLHYCITNGGQVPNAVPADAEVWYMIRAPKREQVVEVKRRLMKVAEGAATMTETSVSHEVLSGCYDMIINRDLAELFHQNLVEAGPPKFDKDDYAMAEAIVKEIPEPTRQNVMGAYYLHPNQIEGKVLMDDIQENDNWDKVMPGTFDHGDVSHIVPFAYLFITALPVGVAGHTWPVTACAGAGMGTKAVLCGARVMAGTVYDLLKDTRIVEKAKTSFQKDTGGKKYVSAFQEE